MDAFHFKNRLQTMVHNGVASEFKGFLVPWTLQQELLKELHNGFLYIFGIEGERKLTYKFWIGNVGSDKLADMDFIGVPWDRKEYERIISGDNIDAHDHKLDVYTGWQKVMNAHKYGLDHLKRPPTQYPNPPEVEWIKNPNHYLYAAAKSHTEGLSQVIGKFLMRRTEEMPPLYQIIAVSKNGYGKLIELITYESHSAFLFGLKAVRTFLPEEIADFFGDGNVIHWLQPYSPIEYWGTAESRNPIGIMSEETSDDGIKAVTVHLRNSRNKITWITAFTGTPEEYKAVRPKYFPTKST